MEASICADEAVARASARSALCSYAKVSDLKELFYLENIPVLVDIIMNVSIS